MFFSLFIVAAIAALIFWYKRWEKIPEADKKSFAKQSLLLGSAIVVLGLVVTGRAHWLMGVLAALLALVGRVAQFAQYIPLFNKIFGKNDAPFSSAGQATVNKQSMTPQQAAEILGIDAEASDADIRLAHKKLIQKMHPDRGGSNALAKQINLAKDCLLK